MDVLLEQGDVEVHREGVEIVLSSRCDRKHRYAAMSLEVTDKRRVLALQFRL